MKCNDIFKIRFNGYLLKINFKVLFFEGQIQCFLGLGFFRNFVHSSEREKVLEKEGTFGEKLPVVRLTAT